MEVKILGKNEAGIKINNYELNDLLECLNHSIESSEHTISMSDAELQTTISLSGLDAKAVPFRKKLIQFKQRLQGYTLVLNSLFQ